MTLNRNSSPGEHHCFRITIVDVTTSTESINIEYKELN